MTKPKELYMIARQTEGQIVQYSSSIFSEYKAAKELADFHGSDWVVLKYGRPTVYRGSK